MPRLRTLTLAPLLALACLPASAADPKDKDTEADYYTITTLPIPPGVVLEVGALEMLPGDVLAAIRRRRWTPPAGAPDSVQILRQVRGYDD